MASVPESKIDAMITLRVMRLIVTLCLLLPRVAAAGDEAPAPLKCLQRYYGVQPSFSDGNWWATLADGRRLVYDDGKPKSFETRLDGADLEDMFAIQYRPGPIAPVTTADDDPGRIRVDALFVATYPPTLTKIDFLGRRLTVHKKVAAAFERVAARLQRYVASHPEDQRFLGKLGGTFVVRKIAGTERASAHSYGVSIDINDALSHYWRWQRPPMPLKWRNTIPQGIVDAFEAEGFIWGGRWYHYDTMHFEYRPELIDPACVSKSR
jgi:hypothetical protein